MESPDPHKPFKNKVLSSLPTAEINCLAPHLVSRTFRRNLTLYSPGQRVDTVYFLEGGLCSIVVTVETGSSIEVGIIGRDSFVGLPAFLGNGESLGRSMIQVAGAGYCVKASILEEQIGEGASQLRLWLQRGLQGLLAQAVQSAACNRLHTLDERLARWLLMCRDRVQLDDLPITHEFLSMMLGASRSCVTVAAGTLQKAGLITCARGRVRIENRKGLEDASCECYSIVHNEYVRLGLL